MIVSMNSLRKKISLVGISFSVFLFFSISLAFPTGYSYGALGMLIFSLIGYDFLNIKKIDSDSKIFAVLLFLMGGVWGLSFDDLFGVSGTDYWLKYYLALFCLCVISRCGVLPGAVICGVAVGALGALGIAIYQILILNISKATGFTNAIQYGGIAMYLGWATWCFAFFAGYSTRYSMLLWLAGAAGISASLFSGTRGAWIVAPLLLIIIFITAFKYCKNKLLVISLSLFFILSSSIFLTYSERITSRINSANIEFNAYLSSPVENASSSIGQRLEQWALAWKLGAEKPFFGWGIQGFVDAKEKMIEGGLAHPSVKDYGHAHNEILDMFAKRGLFGVAVLLMFYAVPLAIFWPTNQRIQLMKPRQKKIGLALRTAASLLPIAYFGFGWTQVFFAHNSGHMFYVFSLVAFWGAIRYLEGKTAPFKH